MKLKFKFSVIIITIFSSGYLWEYADGGEDDAGVNIITLKEIISQKRLFLKTN